MNTIRKLSVGRDYKVDAMHYQLNQQVYGGHVICDIIEEEHAYCIYIKKDDEILPWKSFNKNMGISIEFNLDYE